MTLLKAASIKLALSFLVIIAVGFALGQLSVNNWPFIKQLIASKPLLYSSSNQHLTSNLKENQVKGVGWSSLLPEKEQEILADYQVPQTPSDDTLSTQIFRSLEASVDPDYQQALNSTSTVAELENQIISISGFIVPIDFHQSNNVRSLFIVPYFGACIHFPPPPPNQMIFAQLEAGFADFDISKAYTVTGKLRLGLFEDLMGTSAYIIDVASIVPFYGEPDDFRQHQ